MPRLAPAMLLCMAIVPRLAPAMLLRMAIVPRLAPAMLLRMAIMPRLAPAMLLRMPHSPHTCCIPIHRNSFYLQRAGDDVFITNQQKEKKGMWLREAAAERGSQTRLGHEATWLRGGHRFQFAVSVDKSGRGWWRLEGMPRGLCFAEFLF